MDKRILCALIVLISLFSVCAFATSVVRQLPASVSPGETFTVSLIITATNGDAHFAIEEKPPEEFIFVSASSDAEQNPSGSIIWPELNNGSETVTYTLTAPQSASSSTFSGEYSYFWGDASGKTLPYTILTIGGDITFGDGTIIEPPSGDTCTTNADCAGTETCTIGSCVSLTCPSGYDKANHACTCTGAVCSSTCYKTSGICCSGTWTEGKNSCDQVITPPPQTGDNPQGVNGIMQSLFTDESSLFVGVVVVVVVILIIFGLSTAIGIVKK